MTATAYGKAQVGTGGDFPIPEIEDGYYPARIMDIKDGESTWEGVTRPQYIVIWECDDQVDEDGNNIQLAQFVAIPDGVRDSGILNNESNLYKLMEAIGCDMEEPEIDPGAWIDAKAKINVENRETKQGPNAGQVRPRIVGVKPAPKVAAAKAKAATARPARQQQDEDF